MPGDRVIAFHHIPCGECFYCRRKLYAQCPVYKKVGVTAGFEPAGGGFAEYVRVMDWIVRRGVEKFDGDVPFARACFVEPVNTCLKAVMRMEAQPDETALILGQGPIGLHIYHAGCGGPGRAWWPPILSPGGGNWQPASGRKRFGILKLRM